MYTPLPQQQNWTTNAAPSCLEVHQHLDDVPFLLDEPSKGSSVHPVQDCLPGRSFSLSSNAEAMSNYFSA
jgi:hypothetical protein